MILYNMRYRGQLEYDKFVLNSMQLHNEAYSPYVKEFEDESASNMSGLAQEVLQAYEAIVGKEDTDPNKTVIGQSDKLYYMLLNNKG